MLKNYFGSGNRPEQGRISRSFFVLLITFAVISAAVWLFYRSTFMDGASIFGMIVMGGVCAWFWAYLVGFSRDED